MTIVRDVRWFKGVVIFPLAAWCALPGSFAFWPLLFICLLPLFLWLSEAEDGRGAFLRGLLAGIVFYSLQLYWIVSVLTTFGGLPFFVSVLALLLLVCYMSVYLGLFSYCFKRFNDTTPVTLGLVGIPAAWVGVDWLRSWFISGFPWMDFGYGLWSVPQALQIADLFGHHGLTFMVVLVNLVISIFIRHRFSGFQKIISAGVLVVLLSGGLFYSRNRWEDVIHRVDVAAAAEIGIVQGNIEQVKKWSPEERLKTVESYLQLSRSLVAGGKKPDLLVWPETALPFYPRGNELLRPISTFLRQSDVTLLAGAPWYEVVDWEKRQFSYYNGAFIFSGSGVPGDSYFKSHLVPYGEYVPLKKYMPFLAPLVEAAGDFTPGVVGTPLAAGSVRAGVLICYESIFADIGRRWVENGANLLVNLTNDAWYGKSSAPYQSWAMTVLRAVETRRSLVRSANTGISGIIDPLGRVRSRSELFVAWAETARVPLMTGKTHYVSRGFLFAPVCAAVGFLLCSVTHLMDQRRKKWYRDA